MDYHTSPSESMEEQDEPLNLSTRKRPLLEGEEDKDEQDQPLDLSTPKKEEEVTKQHFKVCGRSSEIRDLKNS